MYQNTHKFFFSLDSKRIHASDSEACTVLGVLSPVSDLGVLKAVSRVSDLQLFVEGVSRPALVVFEGVSRPALVVAAVGDGVAGTSMPISPIILRSLCVLGIHGSERGGSELSGVAAAAAAAAICALCVCAQLLLPPPPPLCPVATLSPSSPAANPSTTAMPPPLDAYCPPASVP